MPNCIKILGAWGKLLLDIYENLHKLLGSDKAKGMLILAAHARFGEQEKLWIFTLMLSKFDFW